MFDTFLQSSSYFQFTYIVVHPRNSSQPTQMDQFNFGESKKLWESLISDRNLTNLINFEYDVINDT